MDKLPFFYYDILSRITPGAAALATLFVIQEKMPASWHYFFVDGQQGWKTVIVPLVLGGLAYAIGVLFEAIDHSFPWRKAIIKCDTLAFRSAWSNHHTSMDRKGEGPRLQRPSLHNVPSGELEP